MVPFCVLVQLRSAHPIHPHYYLFFDQGRAGSMRFGGWNGIKIMRFFVSRAIFFAQTSDGSLPTSIIKHTHTQPVGGIGGWVTVLSFR